jgi:flagellar motor component MotA
LSCAASRQCHSVVAIHTSALAIIVAFAFAVVFVVFVFVTIVVGIVDDIASQLCVACADTDAVFVLHDDVVVVVIVALASNAIDSDQATRPRELLNVTVAMTQSTKQTNKERNHTLNAKTKKKMTFF